MAPLNEIRRERLRKLEILREHGIDPYPVESHRTHTIAVAIKDFSKLTKRKSVTISGRVLAIRGQGALTFFDFTDGTGTFQGLLKKSDVDEAQLRLFTETVDVGDFVEIRGSLFLTKREEKTILVQEWRMLAKSLRPLPDKWHGLQDVEERFRRRYLDLLMSPEVKQRFLTRSKLVSSIRTFLDKAGFVEVETPALQPLAGGTNARPFVTHHEALDIDLFLRIAEELYLKRLLVGGWPKVYSIAKNFRNEGVDVTHNPEFTMLEFYEAYSSAQEQMEFVEELFRFLLKEIIGERKLKYQNHEIDFGPKFAVIDFYDVLRRHALITNPESISHKDLELKASQFGVTVVPGDAREKILDNIYKKVCRSKLIQPTFVVSYPVDYLPLAKRLPKTPDLVDAFQLVAGGMELVKAFSELNDPLDQLERFTQQEKRRLAGDKEAQPLDEDFIEALEYGMPPAGGVGIGIDRLVMLLTNARNIKEVIFFPTLKSRNNEEN